MARHVESVPPGCSAPPPGLPEPRQPFEMVGAGPHHEPTVAFGGPPPPRPCRRFGAVGGLQLRGVDVLPTAAASAMKPGQGSPGWGITNRITAPRDIAEGARLVPDRRWPGPAANPRP